MQLTQPADEQPATILHPTFREILHRHYIPTQSEIRFQGLCRSCEAQWPWQLLSQIIDSENYTPYTESCNSCGREGFVEEMVSRGVMHENEMRALEGVEPVPEMGSRFDWSGGRAGGYVVGEVNPNANVDASSGTTGSASSGNPRRRPQGQARTQIPGETGSLSRGLPASLTRSSELRVGDVGMGFYKDAEGKVDVGTGEIVQISRERIQIGPPRHPEIMCRNFKPHPSTLESCRSIASLKKEGWQWVRGNDKAKIPDGLPMLSQRETTMFEMERDGYIVIEKWPLKIENGGIFGWFSPMPKVAEV
ncbi:hypothetical protein BDV06DRAFT_220334 [Aspergillus oleicola]